MCAKKAIVLLVTCCVQQTGGMGIVGVWSMPRSHRRRAFLMQVLRQVLMPRSHRMRASLIVLRHLSNDPDFDANDLKSWAASDDRNL